jgi:hypothetical protein
VSAYSIRLAWTAVFGCSIAAAATPPHQSSQNSAGISATVGTGKVKQDAIVGTGVQAIVGTGKVKQDAIVGTGVQAIVGTGVQAIVGTGSQAIVGTGVQAIVGTGSQAIVGTGVQAIVGTGRTVTFRGFIDVIDPAKRRISMLGQPLRMPSLDDVNTLDAVQLAIADGRYVELAVEVGSKGQLTVQSLHVFDERYVPGASRVTLASRISNIDSATAQAKIGRSIVDYSWLLATSSAQYILGEVVVVDGIQPAFGSAIIASSIEIIE